MRRRTQQSGRPSIPEWALRFLPGEWLTDEERRAGSPGGDGAILGVRAYKRWRDERNQWAEDNGYSRSEMYDEALRARRALR